VDSVKFRRWISSSIKLRSWVTGPPCDRTVPPALHLPLTTINSEDHARVSVCRFGFVQGAISLAIQSQGFLIQTLR
jgi:hypothetical protein